MKKNNGVVFLIQSPVPLKGAPAQRIRVFCRHLMREGYEVYVLGGQNLGEVLASRLGVSLAEKIEAKRSEHTTVCLEINASFYLLLRIPYISTLINLVLAFFNTIYLLIKKPRFIIVTVPPSDLVLATYIAARLIRSRYIIDVRDPYEEIQLYYSSSSKLGYRILKFLRGLNYAIYRRADAVIFVTNGIKDMMRKYGIRGVIIPNGADLEVFKPTISAFPRRDKSELTLVFSGRASRYYNLITLILALKKLNKDGIRIKLLLVGTIYRGLRDLIKKLDVEELVKYLGFLSPNEVVSKVFSISDVGVIPRTDDPIFDYAIPAKFYEYIASGLPIFALCRRESDLAKLILSCNVGWVCEYKDLDCIIRTLKEIYTNRALIDEKRENALRIRRYFDRSVHARMLLRVLKTLS
jgi:glycosyltransferase involved in cell wall biosynthesis